MLLMWLNMDMRLSNIISDGRMKQTDMSLDDYSPSGVIFPRGMKQTDMNFDDYSPWAVTASPKGVSRLENEFEVLQFVGKGAFGDVLKVRNKLDRCLYAIKRIELNPMNKLLYKKITREVKLLSRLNHENVVRYFNSWIETTNQDNSSSSQTEKVSIKYSL
ncbi:Eukaryotic translation initiation factor 2 alpha kinase 4 [Homalodisca vitripennis]|nr:Eukaryotic translation initiation factor 2 alpha kinase 4 [Homalodisca vitripennis]